MCYRMEKYDVYVKLYSVLYNEFGRRKKLWRLKIVHFSAAAGWAKNFSADFRLMDSFWRRWRNSAAEGSSNGKIGIQRVKYRCIFNAVSIF